MTIFLGQVVIPSTSGLAADAITNTFHVSCNLLDLATADGLIHNFYNVAPPTETRSIASYLSSDRSRATNDCSIRWYEVAGPPPHPPVGYDQFTLGNAFVATKGSPNEVAVVISYQGDKSVIPVAEWPNLRGRLYLGPLADGTDAVADGPPSRPSLAMRGVMGKAYAKFVNDMTTAGIALGIYSRTTGNFYTVHTAYLDDAWDTQRRRGLKPTSRYVAF